MIDYSRELKEQKQEVDRLVQKTKKHKKAFEGLAEGNIRVSASNGCPQYYFTEKGSGHGILHRIPHVTALFLFCHLQR